MKKISNNQPVLVYTQLMFVDGYLGADYIGLDVDKHVVRERGQYRSVRDDEIKIAVICEECGKYEDAQEITHDDSDALLCKKCVEYAQ